MRIGVDVDGVLTGLESYQLKYGKKYFKNVKDIDETAYDICDIFHCSQEEREKFWTRYIWKYCLVDSIRQDAKAVIDKLKEDGHEIFILTGRAHTTENNARGKLFRQMLEYWLKKNGVQYDEIYYCSEDKSATEKYDLCKELGIDVIIEDKKENIDKIKDIADVVCIRTGYNKGVRDEEHVHVTTTLWDAYKIIRQIEKPNDFVPLSKEQKESMSTEELGKYFEQLRDYYQTLPFDIETNEKLEKNYVHSLKIGMPVFNLLYKPIILNKDKIPDGNGIIFVSNHLGSLDQFPIMSAIGDRPIHFLASSTLLPLKRGALYKNTGSIFVDRTDAKSREASKEKMAQYLLNDSNVFLFPEGTRNYLRSEHIDLLYDMYDSSKMSKEDFSNMLLSQQHLSSQVLLIQEMYKNHEISYEEFSKALSDMDGFLRENLAFKEYVDSWMLPFKLGAVALAQSTGATIVPFAVNKNYKIGGKSLLVRVGNPMTVSAGDDLVERNLELRNQISSMVAENIKLEEEKKLIKNK